MSTFTTASEIQLADLACNRLTRLPNVRVLIGGLGLGCTLRRVLSLMRPDAQVDVAELSAEVVEWNRTLLGQKARVVVSDERVKVTVDDVWTMIKRAEPGTYHAILLDVDNGPVGPAQGQNSRLYDRTGLERIARALQPTGCAAFWSASEDRPFAERLERFFRVETIEAKSHPTAKRAAHRIYLATHLPPETE